MPGINERTITLEELRASGVDTCSKKCTMPRGVEDVSVDSLKIGDKVVIDNYFHKIIE